MEEIKIYKDELINNNNNNTKIDFNKNKILIIKIFLSFMYLALYYWLGFELVVVGLLTSILLYFKYDFQKDKKLDIKIKK